MIAGNNTIILYHGSRDIIKTPLYGAGNRYNDYGQGFYCTGDMDLAREWAVEEKKDRDGYVNCYSLDMTSLSVLDLDSPGYNILHWLTILLQNREFAVHAPLAADAKEYLLENFSFDYHGYDIICGYRADDSYFAFAHEFLSGIISLRQLSNAMYLGNLGRQTVLKSRKGFSQIEFTGAEQVPAEIWYPRAQKRDREARDAYLHSERRKTRKDDIMMFHILHGEVSIDDPRVQRYLSVGRTEESRDDGGFCDK